MGWNLRVYVLSKYIRFLYWWELFNFTHVIFWFSFVIFLLLRLFLRNYVLRRVWITKTMLFLCYHGLWEILHSIDIQKSSIPFISNSTTICNFRNQISDSFPRWSFDNSWLLTHYSSLSKFNLLSVININLKNVVGSIPIAIIEIVNNIPAKCLETFSLNDQGMIPTQTVHNSLVKHFILGIHLFTFNLLVW